MRALPAFYILLRRLPSVATQDKMNKDQLLEKSGHSNISCDTK